MITCKKRAATVREEYHFKGIFIVSSGGLSSLYTDDKGIVMAFEGLAEAIVY